MIDGNVVLIAAWAGYVWGVFIGWQARKSAEKVGSK